MKRNKTRRSQRPTETSQRKCWMGGGVGLIFIQHLIFITMHAVWHSKKRKKTSRKVNIVVSLLDVERASKQTKGENEQATYKLIKRSVHKQHKVFPRRCEKWLYFWCSVFRPVMKAHTHTVFYSFIFYLFFVFLPRTQTNAFQNGANKPIEQHQQGSSAVRQRKGEGHLHKSV